MLSPPVRHLTSLLFSAGFPPSTFRFAWVLFCNLSLGAGTRLGLTVQDSWDQL